MSRAWRSSPGLAALRAKKGPPRVDPFVAADELVEPMVLVAHEEDGGQPADRSFAFDTVGKMDDGRSRDAHEGAPRRVRALRRERPAPVHRAAPVRPEGPA